MNKRIFLLKVHHFKNGASFTYLFVELSGCGHVVRRSLTFFTFPAFERLGTLALKFPLFVLTHSFVEARIWVATP